MRAELVAVGTELLLGDVVNGNAAWLGRALAEIGVDVVGSVAVGDNPARIRAAVGAAVQRADVVVVTGGLGPTQDDVTREAVAALAGVALQRDPGLARSLTERYAAAGRIARERDLRQADVPAGARVLANPGGTAPGLRLSVGAAVVYLLPGVPHEMVEVATAAVLPELRERAGAATVSRVLHTAGLWESEVAEALAELHRGLERAGNPTVAWLAAGGQTRVRLTAKAADRDTALALLAPVEQQARAALGDAVYGADDDTLDGVVHRLLADRGETVAVAESLTGGLLGATLTDRPGASATFVGGVLVYATPLKESLGGVPGPLLEVHGPVSAEVAAAMAQGVRRRTGADWGLALTGVAGPDPQGGFPPGTLHVGLAGPYGGTVRSVRVPGDRARIRVAATVAALDLLRRTVQRGPDGPDGVPVVAGHAGS